MAIPYIEQKGVGVGGGGGKACLFASEAGGEGGGGGAEDVAFSPCPWDQPLKG